MLTLTAPRLAPRRWPRDAAATTDPSRASVRTTAATAERDASQTPHQPRSASGWAAPAWPVPEASSATAHPELTRRRRRCTRDLPAQGGAPLGSLRARRLPATYQALTSPSRQRALDRRASELDRCAPNASPRGPRRRSSPRSSWPRGEGHPEPPAGTPAAVPDRPAGWRGARPFWTRPARTRQPLRRRCASRLGHLPTGLRRGNAAQPLERGPRRPDSAPTRSPSGFKDEYVSTEHLLLAMAEAGSRPATPARSMRALASRATVWSALQDPRQPARHAARTPRRPTRRWRSTAAT